MKQHELKNKRDIAKETQLLEDCVFLYGLEQEQETEEVIERLGLPWSHRERLPGELMGKHVGAHVTPMSVGCFNDAVKDAARDLYQVSLTTHELTTRLKKSIAAFRSRVRQEGS